MFMVVKIIIYEHRTKHSASKGIIDWSVLIMLIINLRKKKVYISVLIIRLVIYHLAQDKISHLIPLPTNHYHFFPTKIHEMNIQKERR